MPIPTIRFTDERSATISSSILDSPVSLFLVISQQSLHYNNSYIIVRKRRDARTGQEGTTRRTTGYTGTGTRVKARRHLIKRVKTQEGHGAEMQKLKGEVYERGVCIYVV